MEGGVFEPGEDAGGVLESGGVDELEDGLAVGLGLVGVGVGGLARCGTNRDGLVFDEGGDDGGLAFVGVPDDGEYW